MYIYIPTATGQTVPDEVYAGIAEQTVFCKPIVCDTDGVIDSQRNYSAERVAGEIRSRQECQIQAMSDGSDYVLMMDRDIELIDPDTVADMIHELDAHEELGAVALWFGRCPKKTLWMPHVKMSCAMYRKEVFAGIDFSLCTGDMCHTVKAEVERQGYKMRYIDFKPRAKELSL